MQLLSKLCLLVLLHFNTNAINAQSSTKADDKTTAQLNQFRADCIQHWNNDSLESLQTYYANEIRLMPEFQKTILGKYNVLFYEKVFIKRFEVLGYHRTVIEIIDLGKRVIEIGLFSGKLTLRDTKQSHDLNGKYMDLWKRENGRLTLITQAWNYDHSLPWESQMQFIDVPSVSVALQAHAPVNNLVSFELAALNSLMEKTITENDNTIWVQFYSDDATFMYSRHPLVQGKKALTEFFKKHVKDLPTFEKLDIRNDQIDDLGDYVIEYASHIAIIRNEDFSGVFTGKDLAIWRREPNGSLKIFRHIATYDL